MLRLGLQRSDPRERTGPGYVKTAEGTSVPQLRESRKKPGPAREARDYCCEVLKERLGLP